MPNYSSILAQIHKVLGSTSAPGATDADLLNRVVRERDESAFELLLRRHGGMVWSVCRQVLQDIHATEDAFQATFLVLARQARSIRRQRCIAAWLHQVAYRVALKAKTRCAHRLEIEQSVARRRATSLHGAPSEDASRQEQRHIVQDEVARLPLKYRAPVVLCYLEGKTNDEAAQVLGWAKGTLSGRLARARDLLHRRLLRRGVGSSGAVWSALIVSGSSTDAYATLVARTVRAAVPNSSSGIVAGATSIEVFQLTEGVLQAMLTSKLRLWAAIIVIIGFMGSGAGMVALRLQADEQRPSAASEADNRTADAQTATTPNTTAVRLKPANADKPPSPPDSKAAEINLQLQRDDHQVLERHWTERLIQARRRLVMAEEELKQVERERVIQRDTMQGEIKAIQARLVSMQERRAASAQNEGRDGPRRALDEAYAMARDELTKIQSELHKQERSHTEQIVKARFEVVDAEESLRGIERMQAIERDRVLARIAFWESKLQQGLDNKVEDRSQSRLQEVERKLDALLREIGEIRRDLKR